MGPRLGAAGSAAVSRALRSFTARLQASGAGEGAGNLTARLAAIQDEAQTLRATVALASTERVSAELEVEMRASRLAKEVLKLQELDAGLLGTYTDRAGAAKRRQKWLRDRGSAAAQQLLEDELRAVVVDLDLSWWGLRAQLDRYLAAANGQVSAFTEAANMLDAYVSKCNLGFAQAGKGYSKAAAAEQKSRDELQAVWTASVPMLGLLVAKIVDADALGRFVKQDLANAASNPDLMGAHGKDGNLCSGGSTAMRKSAQAVLRAELVEATRTGLFGQTAQQVQVAFQEMGMMKDRFQNFGLPEPADVGDVVSAWQRVQAAYNSTLTSLSALADEAAEEVLRDRC